MIILVYFKVFSHLCLDTIFINNVIFLMPIFTFWLQQALADPIKGMLGTPSRLRTQISLNSGTLLEILPTLCRVNNPEILEPSLSGSPIKIYLDPSICIKHLPFELYVCYNCNTNLAKDQTGVKPH